jgi:hypothetical protein
MRAGLKRGRLLSFERMERDCCRDRHVEATDFAGQI